MTTSAPSTPRARDRARAWALAAVSCIGIVAAARSSVAQSAAAPSAAAPSPAVPAPPDVPAGAVLLGVELAGPAAARVQALQTLGSDLTEREPVGEPPPGTLVGTAPDVRLGLAWVARHAFAASVADTARGRVAESIAPVVGGTLWEDHRVAVRAFIVSGIDADGRARAIRWPADQRGLVGAGAAAEWIPAALAVPRAPLFAAPAPRVPAAAQRHALALRSGGLFVLGELDRCETPPDGPRRCLRWAQVVARDGDRFVPGYLPAMHVARQDSWIRGAGRLPRAQVIVTGVIGDRVQLLVLARGRDDALHRRVISAPLLDGDDLPDIELLVEGDWGTLVIGGAAPHRIALDGTMDQRPAD